MPSIANYGIEVLLRLKNVGSWSVTVQDLPWKVLGGSVLLRPGDVYEIPMDPEVTRSLVSGDLSRVVASGAVVLWTVFRGYKDLADLGGQFKAGSSPWPGGDPNFEAAFGTLYMTFQSGPALDGFDVGSLVHLSDVVGGISGVEGAWFIREILPETGLDGSPEVGYTRISLNPADGKPRASLNVSSLDYSDLVVSLRLGRPRAVLVVGMSEGVEGLDLTVPGDIVIRQGSGAVYSPSITAGSGNPNGVVSGSLGAKYLDEVTDVMYENHGLSANNTEWRVV